MPVPAGANPPRSPLLSALAAHEFALESQIAAHEAARRALRGRGSAAASPAASPLLVAFSRSPAASPLLGALTRSPAADVSPAGDAATRRLRLSSSHASGGLSTSGAFGEVASAGHDVREYLDFAAAVDASGSGGGGVRLRHVSGAGPGAGASLAVAPAPVFISRTAADATLTSSGGATSPQATTPHAAEVSVTHGGVAQPQPQLAAPAPVAAPDVPDDEEARLLNLLAAARARAAGVVPGAHAAPPLAPDAHAGARALGARVGAFLITYLNVTLIFRLGLAYFLFSQGASPDRQRFLIGALVGIYLFSVGVFGQIAERIARCFVRQVGANAAVGVGAAGGAAEGAGAGVGAAAGPAVDRDPMNRLTDFLVAKRGYFVADVAALFAAFFISLIPSWSPDEQLLGRGRVQ